MRSVNLHAMPSASIEYQYLAIWVFLGTTIEVFNDAESDLFLFVCDVSQEKQSFIFLHANIVAL